VHIATDGDRAFIRTYEKAYKAKRLRRRPEAELWLASDGTAPAIVALLRPKQARRVGSPVHPVRQHGDHPGTCRDTPYRSKISCKA
jgi:hypothetical protein